MLEGQETATCQYCIEKLWREREKSKSKKDPLVICFTDTKKHFAIQKHVVEIGKVVDYFVIQKCHGIIYFSLLQKKIMFLEFISESSLHLTERKKKNCVYNNRNEKNPAASLN